MQVSFGSLSSDNVIANHDLLILFLIKLLSVCHGDLQLVGTLASEAFSDWVVHTIQTLIVEFPRRKLVLKDRPVAGVSTRQ